MRTWLSRPKIRIHPERSYRTKSERAVYCFHLYQKATIPETETATQVEVRKMTTTTMTKLLLTVLAVGLATVHGFVPPHVPSSTQSLTKNGISILHMSSSSDADKEDEARRMQEKAEQLRRDIALIEDEKAVLFKQEQQQAEQEREAQRAIRKEQEALRDRYSAVVPILKGDGSTMEEQIDFPPRKTTGESQMKPCAGIVVVCSFVYIRVMLVDPTCKDPVESRCVHHTNVRFPF